MGPPPRSRRLALPGALFAADGRLRHATCVVAAVLLTLPLAAYIVLNEGGLDNQTYVVGVSVATAAVLLFATRRVLVAAAVANGLILTSVAVAAAKYQAMGMVLHAYDIVFYLSSWSTISFLWSDFRAQCLGLAFLLALLAATALVTWRLDTTRVSRWLSAGIVVVAVMVAFTGAYWKGERRHTQYYWEDMHLSSFYSSWGETVETLLRGQLIESAASAPGPLFHVPSTCAGPAKPPHIILIHEESVVPPELFAKLSYDKSLDPFFRSADGKLHKMRVETYGGASWLTEFSILAGVSTRSFGGMRNFVQSLMAGKIHDTLPEALARCGYRNAVFYPMLRNFVSNEKFYKAVGLSEVFDAKDQGAPTYQERDRFYYANALAYMSRHIAHSRQPLFTFIQTMGTHSPYDFKFSPETEVAGGGAGTDPEMSEYLRRLAMAAMDYAEFKRQLAERFPSEQFLIVHYGDHQPVATRSLLGLDTQLEAEDIDIALNSPGFLTYYAVDGLNFAPPPLPAVATLDVPYMPLVILESAGLPLSDSYRARKQLLAVCNGRYFTCADHQRILAFHRRLIDSGLIVPY